MKNGNKLLLIGNPEELHIGRHLYNAARELKLQTRFCDTRKAFLGPKLVAKMNWWLRGHRPTRLREFSKEVIQACREFEPKWILSVGLAPLELSALIKIGKLNVRRLNYLTDDPWNPAHRAPWFMEALPCYDIVFSPRRANIENLRKIGCPKISYLPFAYGPEVHFSEPLISDEERFWFDCDIVFLGNADRDRVPYISRLIRAGFKVGLYGGYWKRFSETRTYTCDHADSETLRKAMSGAKVALCLVRRANRDGNSMRTFEIPAIGTCMLTEDTDEHRQIFGREGENTLYFSGINEMITKAKYLITNDAERNRLAENAHNLIIKGRHTYKDRLIAMLAPLDTRIAQ